MGGFKSKFRDDAEFVYNIGKTIYAAFDNLGTIVRSVLTELRDAVENALFFNGPKYAGYAHGKIVFDAILTTITGGTSLAQSIAVKGLSVFRSLGDDLAVTIKKGVALFAVRKVDDVLLAQLNKLSYGAVTGNYKTFVANNLDNLIINWPTIWAMPSFTNRGKLIEEILALTYYKGFINIGQLKGGTQTLVDFILDPNGLLIQLKSTNAKSVKNIISDFKEVIDKLADLQKSKTFISGDGRNFIVNMARFDICLPKELFNNNKALFDELNNYVSRHTVAVIDINYIKK